MAGAGMAGAGMAGARMAGAGMAGAGMAGAGMAGAKWQVGGSSETLLEKLQNHWALVCASERPPWD